MLPAHLCIDGYRHGIVPLGPAVLENSERDPGRNISCQWDWLSLFSPERPTSYRHIIGILICQALIVQGDLGVKERVSPLEDWWEARGLSRTEYMEEQEM
ncbi:MAG: hypothetical protein H0V70_18695 [Ktedonobacteraceae bacterium]|nr:hypothetical protein [Ktedonobacteraceae bacterium]